MLEKGEYKKTQRVARDVFDEPRPQSEESGVVAFNGDIDAYISLGEAAQYTRFSQDYLSLLARKGALPAKKFGRNWNVRMRDVEEYIARVDAKAAVRKQAPAAQAAPDTHTHWWTKALGWFSMRKQTDDFLRGETVTSYGAQTAQAVTATFLIVAIVATSGFFWMSPAHASRVHAKVESTIARGLRVVRTTVESVGAATVQAGAAGLRATTHKAQEGFAALAQSESPAAQTTERVLAHFEVAGEWLREFSGRLEARMAARRAYVWASVNDTVNETITGVESLGGDIARAVAMTLASPAKLVPAPVRHVVAGGVGTAEQQVTLAARTLESRTDQLVGNSPTSGQVAGVQVRADEGSWGQRLIGMAYDTARAQRGAAEQTRHATDRWLSGLHNKQERLGAALADTAWRWLNSFDRFAARKAQTQRAVRHASEQAVAGVQVQSDTVASTFWNTLHSGVSSTAAALDTAGQSWSAEQDHSLTSLGNAWNAVVDFLLPESYKDRLAERYAPQQTAQQLAQQPVLQPGGSVEPAPRAPVRETVVIRQGQAPAQKERPATNVARLSSGTSVAGDLGVTGTTTLADLVVNGTASFANGMQFTTDTNFTGPLYNSAGVLTINDDVRTNGRASSQLLEVDGLADVGSLYSRGQANIQGPLSADELTVRGNATIDGTLQISGTFQADSLSARSFVTAYHGLSTGGSLYVEKDASFNKDVTIEGVLTTDDDITTTRDINVGGDINADGTLRASGAAQFEDEVTVDGNTSIGGTLNVTGDTTLGGDLNIAGLTSFTGTTTFSTLVVAATSSDATLLVNQKGAGNILQLQDEGSDVLTLADGGNLTYDTNTFFLDASTNRVGIGTTSPAAQMTIWGHSTSSAASLFTIADSASSTLLTVLDTGNAGIGDARPDFGLEVAASSSSGYFAVSAGESGDGDLFVVKGNGNIGIGTTTPYETFSVAGSGVFTDNLRLDGTTGLTFGGAGAGLTFTSAGDHLISASAGTLKIGTSTVVGDISAGYGDIDIGSVGTRFGKIYADEINASTLVGTLSAGNLTASTFTINSDNSSADSEDGYLVFERGSVTPNTVFAWDSAADEVTLNAPLHMTGTIGSGTGLLLDSFTTDITTGANQDLAVIPNGTGRTGIGTTTPSAYLTVWSPDASGSTAFNVVNNASTTLLSILSGGNVGIGTSSPYAKLSVAGTVVGDAFTATSTTASSTFQLLNVASQSSLGTVVGGVWQGTEIGVSYGGTGLTSAPSYGQLLLGNASGGYDLTATSSLGLVNDTTGDWTGTFDGQEGSYYLDAQNHTNFGIPFYTYFAATTTDALTEGATNRYYADSLARAAISEDIIGLAYNTTTGVLSTTTGYVIPLTASTTEWATAYNWGDHSTAGYLNDIDFSTNGLMVRTSSGAYTNRTLATSSDLIVITNTDGTSGNPTFSLRTATPTSGDSNNLSTAGQIYDFVTGQGYLTGLAQLGQIGDVSTTTLAYGSILRWDGTNTWDSVATSTLNIALTDTTGTLAISRGGTGLTGAPSYGQLLLGNISGGYTLSATSSLFTTGIDTLPSGTSGQTLYHNGAAWNATSSLYLADSGFVGIGTTSPGSALDVDTGSLRVFGDVVTDPDSDSLTFLGVGAGANNVYSSSISGADNTFIGYHAGQANTSGYRNTAVGSGALAANTNGNRNLAVGYQVLTANTSGSFNTALGPTALSANTTGANNAVVGYGALSNNTTGSFNAALGYGALLNNPSATSTVAIGYQAGYGINGAHGSQNNVLIGYRAGYGLTTGDNNILLGYQAGNNLTSGGGNIVIGYDIDTPTAASANTLTIGNLIYGTGIDGTGTTLSSGNVGIGTTSPAYLLDVDGDFRVGEQGSSNALFVDATNGQVGIGTANPDEKLVVSDSGSTATPKLKILGHSGTIIAQLGDEHSSAGFDRGFLSLYREGSEDIKLDVDGNSWITGGNVGIGTTSPYAKLSVTNTGSGPSFVVEDEASPDATPFIVDASGQVGIGTASPQGTIHSYQGASGGSPNSGVSGLVIEDDITTGMSILTPSSVAGRVYFGDENSNSAGRIIYDHATDQLEFNTNSVATARMVIDNSGNVGIGTTTPDAQLTVYSDSGKLLNLENDVSGSVFATDYYGRTGIGTGNPQYALDINMATSSLFRVATSSASDIFTVTDTQIYAGLPLNLDTTGNVQFGSDLEFTDNTSASIQSASPLYITAGDAGQNASVYLKGEGSGLAVIDDGAYIASSTGIGMEPGAYILQVDHNKDGSNYAYVNNSNAWTSGSADYAEYFWTRDTDLASGEAVCVDVTRENAVQRCRNGADGNLMGIISTNPAVLGNAPGDEHRENNPNYKIVGMLGQVPAKVSTENGAIRPGDSLTSSAKYPGHVMRANPGDPTVGVALESLMGTNQETNVHESGVATSTESTASSTETTATTTEGTATSTTDTTDTAIAEATTGTINVLISRRNKSLTVETVEQKIIEHIATLEIEDEVAIMVQNAVDSYDFDPVVEEIVGGEMATLSDTFDSKLTVQKDELTNLIANKSASLSDKLSAIASTVDAQGEVINGLGTKVSDLEAEIASLRRSFGTDEALSSSTIITERIAVAVATASTSALSVTQDGAGNIAEFNAGTSTVFAITGDNRVVLASDVALAFGDEQPTTFAYNSATGRMEIVGESDLYVSTGAGRMIVAGEQVVGSDIPTSSPDVALEVQGAASVRTATSSQATALTVQQDGSGNIVEFRNATLAVMTVKQEGEVEIAGGSLEVCVGACPDTESFAISSEGDLGVEAAVVAQDYRVHCPVGWVEVPRDNKHTFQNFCVQQSEFTYGDAAAEGFGNLSEVSETSSSQPVTSVTLAEARSYCRALGSGYHLVTEAEWMTVAEAAASLPINDVDGAAAGVQLANGNAGAPHAASAPSASPSTFSCNLYASLDSNANAYDGTCQVQDINGEYGYAGTDASFADAYNTVAAGRNSLRTHVLPNGQVVWDLAGNVAEWTDALSIAGEQPADDTPNSEWLEYADVTTFANMSSIRPSDTTLDSANGAGQLYTAAGDGSVTKGAVRGGSYLDGEKAGVYALDLGKAPTYSGDEVGFRCAR